MGQTASRRIHQPDEDTNLPNSDETLLKQPFKVPHQIRSTIKSKDAKTD